jgi:hypothetical protein
VFVCVLFLFSGLQQNTLHIIAAPHTNHTAGESVANEWVKAASLLDPNGIRVRLLESDLFRVNKQKAHGRCVCVYVRECVCACVYVNAHVYEWHKSYATHTHTHARSPT